MPVDDEVRVGREVVLADARADHGRAGERGEAPGGVVGSLPLALRQRTAVEVSGSTWVLGWSGAIFTPSPPMSPWP